MAELKLRWAELRMGWAGSIILGRAGFQMDGSVVMRI